MHSVCRPNPAQTTVAECSWEYADLPRAFHNNSSCKTWGANRVHYGQLENSEWLDSCNQHLKVQSAPQGLISNWNFIFSNSAKQS